MQTVEGVAFLQMARNAHTSCYFSVYPWVDFPRTLFELIGAYFITDFYEVLVNITIL